MELNEKWLSNLIVFVAYAWIWLNVLPWKLYKVHQNTYLYTHSLTHVSNQNGTSYSKWDARNEIDRSIHHSNGTETPTICRVNMVSLAWMSERTSPFVGKDHWILDFIRFTVVQCDQHFCFVYELRPHEYVGKVWLFSYLIRSYSTWSRIASIYFPSVRHYNVIPNAHIQESLPQYKNPKPKEHGIRRKKRVAIHLRSCEKQKNGLKFLIKVLEDVELVCVRTRRRSKKKIRNKCVEKATVTSLYIQV